MEDFEIYNRYYLKAREDGAIIDAFSDGPFAGREADGYIQFGQGGYQLQLIIDGQETEENPPIWTMDGIPIYKWDGEAIHKRTEAEIEADREKIPPPPPSPMEQLRADVDYLAIMGGVDL